jgi:hypothetical protein
MGAVGAYRYWTTPGSREPLAYGAATWSAMSRGGVGVAAWCENIAAVADRTSAKVLTRTNIPPVFLGVQICVHAAVANHRTVMLYVIRHACRIVSQSPCRQIQSRRVQCMCHGRLGAPPL